MLRSLREKPTDYLRAFLQIDANYRALQLFTYQAGSGNEVRRLLQLSLPREALFPLRYQAGTLLFHQGATLRRCAGSRRCRSRCSRPTARSRSPKVAEAVT